MTASPDRAGLLRGWAGSVQRLIESAPLRAVCEEVGITEKGHSTPPERRALRDEAHGIVDRWLARDLALLAAALAAPVAVDVELRAAAQDVINHAEVDDDFDGEFVDYLVPADDIAALEAALEQGREWPLIDPEHEREAEVPR